MINNKKVKINNKIVQIIKKTSLYKYLKAIMHLIKKIRKFRQKVLNLEGLKVKFVIQIKKR